MSEKATIGPWSKRPQAWTTSISVAREEKVRANQGRGTWRLKKKRISQYLAGAFVFRPENAKKSVPGKKKNGTKRRERAASLKASNGSNLDQIEGLRKAVCCGLGLLFGMGARGGGG